MRQRTWPDFDLVVEEVSEGRIIRQEGSSYIAKKWRLSKDVDCLIDFATSNGFTKLLRRNHPLTRNLLPSGQGVEHIAFSRTYDEHWWFSVNERSARNLSFRQEIRKFTVSDKLCDSLKQASIPFKGESRNKNAPEVAFSDYAKFVKILSASKIDMNK